MTFLFLQNFIYNTRTYHLYHTTYGRATGRNPSIGRHCHFRGGPIGPIGLVCRERQTFCFILPGTSFLLFNRPYRPYRPNRQSTSYFLPIRPIRHPAYPAYPAYPASGLFSHSLASFRQPGLEHPLPDPAIFHEIPLLTLYLPVQQIIALGNQADHDIGERSG